jgi:hypothetical protein
VASGGQLPRGLDWVRGDPRADRYDSALLVGGTEADSNAAVVLDRRG